MIFDMELTPFEEGTKDWIREIVEDAVLVDFTDLEATESDYNPPPYGVPGRILFEFDPEAADTEQFEVLDYNDDTSVFWLNEGIGFNYFFENYTDYASKLEKGRYVMTVCGEYIKGMTWRESPEPYDDDEEWTVVKEAEKTTLETLL